MTLEEKVGQMDQIVLGKLYARRARQPTATATAATTRSRSACRRC